MSGRHIVLARRLLSSGVDAPIQLEVKDSKDTLKLNRPKIGNALGVDLAFAHRTSPRPGPAQRCPGACSYWEGKYFCTGMNLGSKGESLSGNNEEQHERRECDHV
jgi:hypothetical protein